MNDTAIDEAEHRIGLYRDALTDRNAALVEALEKAQGGLGSAIHALINRHAVDHEMFLEVAEAAELDAQIAYDAVQVALKAAEEPAS